jgi:site-specific recombinase XerD
MKSPKTEGALWQPTSEPCLYRHRDSGRYFSRFLVGGNRSFKSLGTDKWAHALAKHSKRRAVVTQQRAIGAAPQFDENLRTLGDCTRRLLKHLELTRQQAKTKINYARQIDVVRKNWPDGTFDFALPSNVTYGLLLKLRQALLTCEWEAPAGFKGKGGKRTGTGYSARYVNQCLARLQNVIEVARVAELISHDPFASGIGIQESIWLPLPKANKDLPSLDQMKQVFKLMAGDLTPEKPGHRTANEPNWLKWRLDRALDAAELAEFLAFTGCRISEAVGEKNNGAGASFEDFNPNGQHGPTMRIHGTKGVSSDRVVDAVPDFVELIARIKRRREKDGLPTTGTILRVKGCRYGLETASAKVGCMRLGHHTLRHYFASITLGAGVPATVVADWMGHADKGATLLRTYAHVIRQHSAAYAKRVSYSPPQAA